MSLGFSCLRILIEGFWHKIQNRNRYRLPECIVVS